MLRASAVHPLLVNGELLDEDFFSSPFAIADLCWRAHRANMIIRLVPDAVVWRHRRLFTSAKNMQDVRNRIWLMVKNDELVNVFVHLPWIVPFICLRDSSLAFFGQAIGVRVSDVDWIAAYDCKKRRVFSSRVKIFGKGIRSWFV